MKLPNTLLAKIRDLIGDGKEFPKTVLHEIAAEVRGNVAKDMAKNRHPKIATPSQIAAELKTTPKELDDRLQRLGITPRVEEIAGGIVWELSHDDFKRLQS